MTAQMEWSYPRTVEEALALLKSKEPRREAVAGGTSWHFHSPPPGVGFVDLGRLPLRTIELREGWLQLGALLSVEELRRSAALAEHAPLLREVAQSMRPMQLRNGVTLGGNCVQVFPWSDFPVATLALGARFHLDGRDPCLLDADEFFSSHPRKKVEGRLLTGVSVPQKVAGSGSAFIKLARSKVDLALVTAAVVLKIEQGRVSFARVSLGAVRGLPVRMKELETELVGSDASDPGLIDRAVEMVRGALNPIQDVRVSREYRRQVAGVIAARALARALSIASLQP